MSKLENLVIIGPSSSGKTTIATELAKITNGVRISLDGQTSAGRALWKIIPVRAKKGQFLEQNPVDIIRDKMAEEALAASKEHKPFIIDDISADIIRCLHNRKLKFKT